MQWTSRAETDTATTTPGDRLTELVKNAYRVLLSRGMKGCYFVFLDNRDRELREVPDGARSGRSGTESGRAPRQLRSAER